MPLPNTLIIGAQKSGTSALHAYLAAHPAVCTAHKKELHYFDRLGEHPPGWYAQQFAPAAGQTILLESTPYYLFHPLVPARVRALVPTARLIVLLRDPAERAVSHHQHEVARGTESLPLREALAAEPARLAGSDAALHRGRSRAHSCHSYVARGRYAEQLERWLSFFPREQLLVLPSARLRADTAQTVVAVQRWLGLDPMVPEDLSPQRVGRYAPAPEDVLDALRMTFADEPARVRRLLGSSYAGAFSSNASSAA